jgi:hypothetical protein
MSPVTSVAATHPDHRRRLRELGEYTRDPAMVRVFSCIAASGAAIAVCYVNSTN